MADAESIMATIWGVQGILSSLTALDLTGYMFPESAVVPDGKSVDFIIAGAGSAGSVIARRLVELEFKVLLIEAGGDPQLESVLGGLFVYQPNTTSDWNYFSEPDNFSSPYHKNKVTALTQGKMLGGSSSLDHLLHVRGNPHDFDTWAEIAGDSSWNWDGMYHYLRKSQRLVDEKLLATREKEQYGVDGFWKLEQQPHKEVEPILEALKELGNPILRDTNRNISLGYSQPIFDISEGKRQSTALAALGDIKTNPNLLVLKNTLVTKIVFDGNKATGVEAITPEGKTVTYNCKKEVIVTAGALNTPKLLMLSGVGPKQHLESFGINVVADLPVGQNLQDHISVQIFHTLDASNVTLPSANPTLFPVPSFIGYKAMDESQTYPDYQAIGLFFPHDATAIVALCSNVFTYTNEVCDTVFKATKERNLLWTVHNIMHPQSRGQVLLRSTDPNDAPVVHTGAFSNKCDLVKEAKYLADYAQIVNTTYFKSLGSEMVDFGFPECADLKKESTAWWECYTLNMMGTMFHYSGTCSLGSVLDSKLRVKGVTNLRVADSSAMPYVTSGNIQGPVVAIAEKASDLIKQDWNVPSAA